MRRCIVETTPENEPVIRRLLPANITATAPTSKCRMTLEGPGLPVWCEYIAGCCTPRAVLEVLDDGTFRFIPGGGLPAEQVPEKFRSPTA